MFDISFVIMFHSSRIGNLEQTLRFLARRERDVHKFEFILLCQDQMASVTAPVEYKLTNVARSSYNRSHCINRGVREANSDVIAILDSDRVLPANYFRENIPTGTNVVTTKRLYRFQQDATDEQVEQVDFSKLELEQRSQVNETFSKTLLSGNTLIRKDFYLSCGGMDERYNGYGFEDNDFTQTILAHGGTPVFVDVNEIHLYHPRTLIMGDEILPFEKLRFYTCLNGLRYHSKWKIPLNQRLLDRVNIIKENEALYKDLPLYNDFNSLLKGFSCL